MNARGTGRDPRSMTERARDAWGTVPDWVLELASLADREGQKKAGARIGYSGSVVSEVINARYGNGDLGRVEEKVRGALMGLEVDCPVLGSIGRDLCLDEQKQPFRATSRHRAELYHACRNGCPHSRLKDNNDD
jgi:hypothetical protein